MSISCAVRAFKGWSSIPSKRAASRASRTADSAFGLSDLTSRATTATLGKSSWTKYIDIFWTLMPISVAAVPLALVLRTIKLGTGAPERHIDNQGCDRRSHASASG